MYKWFLNWFGKPDEAVSEVWKLTGTIEWICLSVEALKKNYVRCSQGFVQSVVLTA